ncbi:hypothetical protein FO519_000998 [Halicephalobus sp. NKZ332]|nr:hypothetical protein FO519_000998 [Halicephalobus sp. NKZ332]
MKSFSVFVFTLIQIGCIFAQINLGTLNLNKNQNGDLEFGFGQSANIFGFGGDREIAFTSGPGKFDTQLGGGTLIGGERLGLDGGVGVKEGQGLNLGSNLKFGNAPPNPNDPAGQLNSFLNNVGYFFQRFAPPPLPSSPLPSPPSTFTPPAPTFGSIGINSGEAVNPETPVLIPETAQRPERIRVTTEGRRRNGPPVPEGLASITEISDHDDDADRLADLQ